MRDWPQELVFFVLFGAVLLFQALRRRVRQRAAAPTRTEVLDAPAEAPADALPAAPEAAGWLGSPPPPRPPRPSAPRRAVARPTAADEGLIRRRRFSRHALLADRRSLQDAIVTAEILRPCRAQRPHDAD